MAHLCHRLNSLPFLTGEFSDLSVEVVSTYRAAALNPVASIDRVVVPNSAPFGATRSAGECLPPLHAAYLQRARKATVAVRRCRHLVGAAELPALQVGRVRLPHTGGQSAQSLTSRYRRYKRGRYIPSTSKVCGW